MNISLQLFLLISFVMAAVTILLFIVNAIFAKKISAKVRYLMWIVILFGLLIPFRPMIGDGIITVPDFVAPVELAQLQPQEVESNETIETPIIAPNVSEQATIESKAISFQTIAFAVWLSVALGIIGYHLFQYIRFQQTIKRWGEVEEDEHSLAIFERIKREMNLENRKVQLVVCGFISTSMLTGFFKPVILLPEKNYDDAELTLIFRHELIHYRRKDLWIKLLSVIAIALHWFNPFVYLMNIALQTEGEASCDQEVLEMSKLKNHHFYAEVIIGMIGGKKSGMTTLATNFYGGKKGIKKRLEEIMTGTTSRKSISYAVLTLILMLTVMSGSIFAMPPLRDSQQNVTEISGEEDTDFYELATAAVGGGAVVESYQISNALLLVRVVYAGDIYAVEIDMTNRRIVGIVAHRQLQDTSNVDVGGYHTEPNIGHHTEQGTNLPQEESGLTGISSQRAGEIALAIVPGQLVEVERDWENGRAAWWVEIRHEGMVHEFYIDTVTGAVLQHEFEMDD